MDLAQLKASIETYAAGKTWYWYLPLWLFGLYAYVELFHFDLLGDHMPFVLAIPYSFDFILHEFAHILTAFLPAVLCAAAGSVSELLLGTGLIIMALKQRSYFASMICFLWFDLACQSAGTYMADAVPQKLPLVSLGAALSGGEPKHDWNFVFGQLHLLGESALIGNTIRVIGALAGTFGVLFAAWLLYKMSQSPSMAESTDITTLHEVRAAKISAASKHIPDDGFTSVPLNFHAADTAGPGQSSEHVDKTPPDGENARVEESHRDER